MPKIGEFIIAIFGKNSANIFVLFGCKLADKMRRRGAFKLDAMAHLVEKASDECARMLEGTRRTDVPKVATWLGVLGVAGTGCVSATWSPPTPSPRCPQ